MPNTSPGVAGKIRHHSRQFSASRQLCDGTLSGSGNLDHARHIQSSAVLLSPVTRALQVELCGGHISKVLEDSTTHLVLIESFESTFRYPQDLLQEVKRFAGGMQGLQHLYAGLCNGEMVIVKQR